MNLRSCSLQLYRYQLAGRLAQAGLPVTLVLDSAVAHVMDKVDMVIVGADAVTENGGVISQVGTYQIAVIAAALGKLLYVAAESFKFTRVFPLNQGDLPGMMVMCNVMLMYEMTCHRHFLLFQAVVTNCQRMSRYI